MRRIVLGIMAAFAFMGLAVAHDLGPTVGAKIPDVAATDQKSAPQTFASLKGSRGLVLLFNRSADWCPYCQAQMIELNLKRSDFEARGYKVAVVTTDTPAKLAAFAEKRQIGYPMLSDAGSKLVDAFGLRDPSYAPGHRAYGVPVPTVFVLSPEGTIKAKLGERDYKIRPTAAQLLETIDALKG